MDSPSSKVLQPKIISRRICCTIGCLGPAEPCPSPVVKSINIIYVPIFHIISSGTEAENSEKYISITLNLLDFRFNSDK